ncbi:hypothetical protein NA56DRAFT_665668 [Hyaloscypha hepaticicola]|uniref:Uncharacterized protein n=1 Tax=Hyaloscypha hepaticicola TaxID=2082293 RepID=A0A2J6PGV6_9HELO|nr:hypothetical protein NA56DRAFT_665668 [Hyaloscypha hepaticicola]
MRRLPLSTSLHKEIARERLLRDDALKPFGDRLETIRFVCSFDLEQDILIYADSNGHIQLPLARLRESDSEPVQRNEFAPFEVPSPLQLDITGFPPPYQNPATIIPDRYFAFTSRVISDFASQCCHILRSYYADTAFRRLAKAVISIATCDFKVVEISDVRHLDQDLQSALKIARFDLKERAEAIIPGDRKEQKTYLLLSIRHVMLCHVDSTDKFSYTAPIPFMNGSSPPFPDAIRLLLQALSPAFPPRPGTPVHSLPLEIQDRILEHVSKGPVEAARLGCG